MKLMMYIGNDLIEAVEVEQESIPLPGYLGKFKRNLKEKYDELIRSSENAPEFIVADPKPQGYNAEVKGKVANSNIKGYNNEVKGNFIARKAS